MATDPKVFSVEFENGVCHVVLTMHGKTYFLTNQVPDPDDKFIRFARVVDVGGDLAIVVIPKT